jgi:hypothetical protein
MAVDESPDPYRFGGAWAKIEILLGLTGVGMALFLGGQQASRPGTQVEWEMVAAALALFVHGGYLALAGHRSHLYCSNLIMTAALTKEIQRSKEHS